MRLDFQALLMAGDTSKVKAPPLPFERLGDQLVAEAAARFFLREFWAQPGLPPWLSSAFSSLASWRTADASSLTVFVS